MIVGKLVHVRSDKRQHNQKQNTDKAEHCALIFLKPRNCLFPVALPCKVCIDMFKAVFVLEFKIIVQKFDLA